MEELKRNLKSALESDHAGYDLHPETEDEWEKFSDTEEVKLFTAGLTEEFSEKEEVQLATEGLIEEFHDTDEQKDVLKETAERPCCSGSSRQRRR